MTEKHYQYAQGLLDGLHKDPTGGDHFIRLAQAHALIAIAGELREHTARLRSIEATIDAAAGNIENAVSVLHLIWEYMPREQP